MENLTCKGLSAAHRRMLIKCITEEIGSIPEPVEIEFSMTRATAIANCSM